MLFYTLIYLILYLFQMGLRSLWSYSQKVSNRSNENFAILSIQFVSLILLFIPSLIIADIMGIFYLVVIVLSICLTILIIIYYRDSEKFKDMFGYSVIQNSRYIKFNKKNYYYLYVFMLLYSSVNFILSLIYWIIFGT